MRDRLRSILERENGIEVVAAVRAVHAGRRFLTRKVSDVVVDGYVREHRASSPVESLSPREREVMLLVVEGRSTSEIADALHLSPKAVETHRSRMMERPGVENVVGLVKFAVQHGLVKPD